MPFYKGCNQNPIYVYDPNPAGKEAVVLLHGWPLNGEMFEYQLTSLEGYRCICIDCRGFGKSAAPESGYSYDCLADDLAQVIKQIGLKCFTLCGFSMGGAIALRYMKRHRGQGVKKLILLAAAAPCFVKRPDFPYGQDWEAVTALINGCATNRPLALEGFNDLFLQRDTDNPFRNWCNLLGLEASYLGTLKCLYSLRDSDLRNDALYVHCPCDILHGREDRVCPYELGEQLNRLIPQSQLYPFERSGHCIFHDELEKFNDVFASCVRSC